MPLYQPPNVAAPVLSQFSLGGKVAAVTGGARGIGTEIVRGLAEAGADVAIIYSSTDASAFAAEVSAATGVRVSGYQANVASRASMAAVVEKIVADFGKLDVMVANAGVCADVGSLEYSEETWARNSAVNLDGVMWTAQAAGIQFRKQGKGNLIITASISASIVNLPQKQAAYNAAKAGAVHLGKSLALEWIDFARVNIISPGYIMSDMLHKQGDEIVDTWTKMTPGKRIAHAAELKSAYVFFASDACSYMTGADLVIDGGYTLV